MSQRSQRRSNKQRAISEKSSQGGPVILKELQQRLRQMGEGPESLLSAEQVDELLEQLQRFAQGQHTHSVKRFARSEASAARLSLPWDAVDGSPTDDTD